MLNLKLEELRLTHEYLEKKQNEFKKNKPKFVDKWEKKKNYVKEIEDAEKVNEQI